MKTHRLSIALLLFSLFFPALSAYAAPTLAFGYLANRSGDSNYDYLETIFPNTIAGTVQNMLNVNVIKPGQINKKLAEYRLVLERECSACDLAGIAEKLSADYFIYGSFTLQRRETIKINVSLYHHTTNKIFTFTSTGKMEAEIFKLVDRTAGIMLDFIKNESFFTPAVVPKGAKLGIFTNLKGTDLNVLYEKFLSNGYQVAAIQADDIRDNLTSEALECFKYTYAGENSYQMISDPRKMKFLHGTWTGEKYYEEINSIKKIYGTYDLDSGETESDILDKLRVRYGLDQVLIIGFNNAKRNAWVRCIDARAKELIWMQAGISGSLEDICLKMIERMSGRPGKRQN